MLSKFFFIFSTALICTFAYADWEELSAEHFQKRVGKKSVEAFVSEEIKKLSTNKTIPLVKVNVKECEEGSGEVWIPATSVEDVLNPKDYLKTHRTPHIWVKRNHAGKIIEFGSSFLLPRDSVSNPKLIEQEVFYFDGEKKSKAYIAND